MNNIVDFEVEGADQYVGKRVPSAGLALIARKLNDTSQYLALAPAGTSVDRIASFHEGGLTGFHETIPALLRVFKRASRNYSKACVCIQMLIANELDFPIGEDFEIDSRPYRIIHNGVTYITAPLNVIDDRLFYAFINFDIGFNSFVALLDQPLSEKWFNRPEPEKRKSILAIAYDLYDGESFLYTIAPGA